MMYEQKAIATKSIHFNSVYCNRIPVDPAGDSCYWVLLSHASQRASQEAQAEGSVTRR